MLKCPEHNCDLRICRPLHDAYADPEASPIARIEIRGTEARLRELEEENGRLNEELMRSLEDTSLQVSHLTSRIAMLEAENARLKKDLEPSSRPDPDGPYVVFPGRGHQPKGGRWPGMKRPPEGRGE